MNSRDQITGALLEARRMLSKSQSALDGLSNGELVDLHERLEEVTDRLGGLIPGATPPGRIEEFFTEVGQGMIASQAELDRQSFVHNHSRAPGALPAAYRIPKVEAEIGFTMSRKKSHGFSFLSLGRASSGEKARNNSVRFEIIAAPPVPEALEEIPIAARLIIRPEDRRQIKTMLAEATYAGHSSRAAATDIKAGFDQVIILAREGQWLLCQPQWGKSEALLYGTLEAAPLQFTSHGAMSPSQAKQPRNKQLFDFLSAISLEQALSLATLREGNVRAGD